jgi:hypothetical protein
VKRPLRRDDLRLSDGVKSIDSTQQRGLSCLTAPASVTLSKQPRISRPRKKARLDLHPTALTVDDLTFSGHVDLDIIHHFRCAASRLIHPEGFIVNREKVRVHAHLPADPSPASSSTKSSA